MGHLYSAYILKSNLPFGIIISGKLQRPLSSRGEEGLGLNGPAINKIRTFFAASLSRALKDGKESFSQKYLLCD